jgi:hypothetical protein
MRSGVQLPSGPPTGVELEPANSSHMGLDSVASRVGVLLVGIAVLWSSAATASAQSSPILATEVSPLDDPEEDCLEPVPETAGASGISDEGQSVRLDAWVLLDDVSRQRAHAVMKRAAETYAPLDIELVVTRYQRVRFTSDQPRPGGEIPSAEDQDLFTQMKEVMDGTRPKGSDVVHLLTGKDVYYMDGGQPSFGLAGVADCIGGVRYANRAFSFSEGTGEYQSGARDLSGIIAAHEIGHLMGAHHHYGNCGQGSPVMQENETPCTVMWPFVIAWNAGNFGTLEGAVVRGHAVDFAAP